MKDYTVTYLLNGKEKKEWIAAKNIATAIYQFCLDRSYDEIISVDLQTVTPALSQLLTKK